MAKQTKKKVATKKKPTRGRPTVYNSSYAEQAYKLCLLGATDARLADFFNVNKDTIYEWQKRHAEFSDSIKKGKDYADAEIAASLYGKAKGCTINREVPVKLTTKEPYVDVDGNVTSRMTQSERIEIVSISEEVPADTTAGIFWLKNRQPKEWRDKQEIESTNVNVNSDVIVTDEEAIRIKEALLRKY